MKKKVLIILGNGFTQDFLHYSNCNEKVDSMNLFKNGEMVPWPQNNKPGFLSYKYCPHLWNLGARPNLSTHDSIKLIEDVITCANILQRENRDYSNIYIKAYHELASYLNALFIYYDSKIDVANVGLENWGWYKYLKKLYEDEEVEKVEIITYNYDIWLERVLKKLTIPFNLVGFGDVGAKFNIYKPHGSISFIHKVKKVVETYSIDQDLDSNDGSIKDFSIQYDNIKPMNKINAIIPPAGDSNRLNFSWASTIRDFAKKAAGSMVEKDELIFCGLSYWHVDRLEVDEILMKIPPLISEVKVINPSPPRVLNAVMTTLYKNILFFNNSEFLGE